LNIYPVTFPKPFPDLEPIWLTYAKRIQALAQAGITYALNDYDLERYQELRDISVDMMAQLSGAEVPLIHTLFANETGYQTPKSDIRGVVFRGGKVLMVKEKIDGCWSLPGGWADIGFTPAEVAEKEVLEEAGIRVKAVRLLAVLDKKCHPHPPSPYHTYKLFFLCEYLSGAESAGMETEDARFFGRNELPPLSLDRNTASQMELMFEYLDNPAKATVFD
jgi:ADP-ribose pyrophosphatase YjhB (NUDIX family)